MKVVRCEGEVNLSVKRLGTQKTDCVEFCKGVRDMNDGVGERVVKTLISCLKFRD